MEQLPSLISLLPPAPGESLFDYPPVIKSMEEAAFYRSQLMQGTVNRSTAIHLSDSTVLVDDEVGVEVVELLSSGSRVCLSIPCRSPLPHLVVQLKDMGRFCSIEALVLDAEGRALHVTASNKQVTVRAEGAALSIPLQLVRGWNMVRLDLEKVLLLGFGARFASVRSVTVNASCRVARIYFEAVALEDAELPPFLRAIP